MVSLVNKKQPNRADENSPILAKATKVESSGTAERDYYLLDADIVTESDLNNSSLQQSDSLSTTISEESDSIHVYDLNKRETKILRHGIIKLSRNPIGECDDTPAPNSSIGRLSTPTTLSPLESTIQQFNKKIFEHAKETRKPPISPTKLKSVHLNRNPRKFKMADMNLSSEEIIVDDKKDEKIGTKVETTTTTTTNSADNNNVETIVKRVETETQADGSVVTLTTVTTEVVEITENLLENEREHSAIAVVTAVAPKLSTHIEQEDVSNVFAEVTSQEATSSDGKIHEEAFHKEIVLEEPLHKEIVHEEEPREEKVHVETFHVKEPVHEEEPIVEQQIEQKRTSRKLSDAEIIFDKHVIDNDEAAYVEIIPATIDESIEYVPATQFDATRSSTVTDHGNVTVEVIRENQMEVVIVSETRDPVSADI